MFMCFVDTDIYFFTRTDNFVLSIILFSSFMFIPLSNFFYGVYQSVVMVKNIKAQNDTEAGHLFNKYIFYFLIYIISTFFLFLLHLADIADHTELNDVYIDFAYVSHFILFKGS